MKASDIPTKFPIPFGNAAEPVDIRPIPVDSQIGLQSGAASLTDGFPPVCFIPVTAGGVPPFGADFNGLFFQSTGWNRWQNAGAGVSYDSDFSAAIGGYPKGAILASTTFQKFWLCTTDDNTNNPDVTSTGWQVFWIGKAPTYQSFVTGTSATYTRPDGCTRIKGRMIAGAGGGAGTGGGSGANGGVTSFGTITAAAGLGATAPVGNTPSNGGATSGNGSGSATLRLPGGPGGSGFASTTGVNGLLGGGGGVSPFGGAGAPSSAGSANLNAIANSGSGGAGAVGDSTPLASGGGGSCGEYVEFQIDAPSATYLYTVGPGGLGGVGSVGARAGSGANGQILIEEFYD